MRIRLHISALMILLLITTVSAAQDMKALKAGVVRIKNNNSGEVGAGFIVGIDQELIYILTASHVVTGDGKPEVYFFNYQFRPLSAEQINRDDDNPKGLALLLVRSDNGQMLAGLATLKFADSSDVNGGEGVKIIGFPASSSFWDVSAGIISHLEGNNLIFAAPVRSGNSGGPVVLSDGRVIGMVTDTTESQGTSSATKAEVLVWYVNGLIRGLIDSNPVGTQKVSPNRRATGEQPTDTEKRNIASNNELLKNSLWLEHGSTINDEKVYLEFESGGRVRTRTPSDPKGFAAANESWWLFLDTVYLRDLDTIGGKPVEQCQGIVKRDRVEGTCKDLTTSKTRTWLLTKAGSVPRD